MSRNALVSGAAVTEPPPTTDPLRRVHVARFAFAVAWAVAFAVSASSLNPLSVTLLVLYPVVDAAAAVVDHRSAGSAGHRGLLVLNVALSLLTAAGLAVAAASGAAGTLRVWGAWAITAGLVQLVLALRRRGSGGQWPLVLSGAISTLAGAGFVLAAGADDPSLTGLAGYATLGGLFFLASALGSRRVAQAQRD